MMQKMAMADLRGNASTFVSEPLTELDLRYNKLDDSAKAALRTAARPALNLRL